MIRLFILDRKPLVIGSVDIQVNASHEYIEIDRVAFYIDDELIATDDTRPYSWIWKREGQSGNKHQIKVIAYDTEGKSASYSIEVRKFL